MKKPKLKRLVSGVVSTALALNTLSVLPAFAAEDDAVSPYPYTIFAGSSEDGAITTTAYNFNVNGNIGTNGTIVSTGNMNVNGQRKEHLSEDMPVIFDEINAEFFSGNVELHSDDYTYSDTNISVSVPLDVNGELDLNGNITITTGVKALDDIELSGEVQNTSDSVICSQNGDITIDSTNVSLTGLIYAPYGTVDITAQNLNLNSVVIIADKVRIDAPNVNANNSTYMAQFVGESYAKNLNVSSDEDVINSIFAYGECNDSSLIIRWLSSEPDGRFDILSSIDNVHYDLLASVDDKDNYLYQLDESVERQFFKVFKAFSNGDTIESPSFYVTINSDGKWVAKFPDSDDDGLVDFIEDKLGTDKDNVDSDNDGLSDYIEYYKTHTDPTNYDSDQNGTSDGDEDFDDDGLSNSTEILIGTELFTHDTDLDGLSDGDEYLIYNTNPLDNDSDDDEVVDGDEVCLGLDPLNPETFGYPDKEYMSFQSLDKDSMCLASINLNNDVYSLSIDANVSGVLEKSLFGYKSVYGNTINDDIVLGEMVDLSLIHSSEVDYVKLKYTINEEFVENELGTFSDVNPNFTNIKRLCVFKYFDDSKLLLPIKTYYDENNNTVYAETDEFGTYCLIDMEKWFTLLNIDPSEFDLETVAAQTVINLSMRSVAASLGNVQLLSELPAEEKIKQADIVFSVDVSSSSTNDMGEDAEGNLERIKSNIYNISKRLFNNGEDIRVAVFGFTSKYSVSKIGYRTSLADGREWATNTIELNYLLNQLYIDKSTKYALIECGIQDVVSPILTGISQYDLRADADKYLFEIAPDQDLRYKSQYYELSTLCSFRALYDALENKNVRLSYVIDTCSFYQILMNGIMQTGGMMGYYNLDTIENDIYDFIFDSAEKITVNNNTEDENEDENKDENDQQELMYISSNGYEKMVLDDELRENSTTNTDKDEENGRSLTDWEEVYHDSELITINEDGTIILPTLEECINYASQKNGTLTYVEKGLENYINENNSSVSNYLSQVKVVPIVSDPTTKDSDGDEVPDIYDVNPLQATETWSECLLYDHIYRFDDLEGVENHDLVETLIDGEYKYICRNCEMEPILSPNQQELNYNYDLDDPLLTLTDYILVKQLRETYTYLNSCGKLQDAEYIYRVIDRIRMQSPMHNYEYHNENGDYVSPIDYFYNDSNNDYHIEIRMYDAGKKYREDEIKNLVLQFEYDTIWTMLGADAVPIGIQKQKSIIDTIKNIATWYNDYSNDNIDNNLSYLLKQSYMFISNASTWFHGPIKELIGNSSFIYYINQYGFIPALFQMSFTNEQGIASDIIKYNNIYDISISIQNKESGLNVRSIVDFYWYDNMVVYGYNKSTDMHSYNGSKTNTMILNTPTSNNIQWNII